MVKMKNIEKKGDIVTLDCYEEGNESKKHHVEFDLNTLEITNNIPNNVYIRQSISKVWTMFRENSNLPKEASSYWY